MNVSITGASKYEQKQKQVAAAVSVITRQEIRNYGAYFKRSTCQSSWHPYYL